ncbi:TlpA disulfide reductase family protein [Salinimicrobium oceani]|uniref:AhpC/TSA family protein n=1 Tax=Salinimicrobium oceani TaxID=2722702 RepID=A0ABX1D1E1_9FLAO|nr:TlpA disulfide reductase family protein [Salinimicrobium oceani]NJW53474.1 AhpC/TSA family protein [Salinimicrobium oceani]
MRNLFILFLVLTLISCGEDKEQGYSISGTIQNVEDGTKIFISEFNDTNTQAVPIDTAIVSEGKFSLDLPKKDQPTISFLNVEGTRGNLIYIADNVPISFEIYPDSIYVSKISGGKDNAVLSSYLKEIRHTNERMTAANNAMRTAYNSQDTVSLKTLQETQQQLANEDKATKSQIVRDNPGSIVSIMIIQDMMNSQAFSASELNALFESLDESVKQSSLAQDLKANLDRMSKTAVGSKAPEFTAPTPTGEQLALKDALGKVTLVDFWASWCRPCRVENPNIVEVYKKYHDQGFNIIQVSLDRPDQKDRWLQAIQDDNLEQWNHVSNLMFWQDPIATEYGVRAIPAAFLLDENGTIVAKDLRGPALGEKVGELLK